MNIRSKNIRSRINSQQLKIMEDVGFVLKGIENTDGYDYAIWNLNTSGPLAIHIKLRINILWEMSLKNIFERIYYLE